MPLHKRQRKQSFSQSSNTHKQIDRHTDRQRKTSVGCLDQSVKSVCQSWGVWTRGECIAGARTSEPQRSRSRSPGEARHRRIHGQTDAGVAYEMAALLLPFSFSPLLLAAVQLLVVVPMVVLPRQAGNFFVGLENSRTKTLLHCSINRTGKEMAGLLNKTGVKPKASVDELTRAGWSYPREAPPFCPRNFGRSKSGGPVT